MFITKMSLSRRTFLRGVGATLSLPFLDAMAPALTAAAKSGVSPTRFGFVYVPHGVILDKWTPSAEGAAFEYTPILKPLEPFRSQATVISGLAGPPDGGGGHAGASATWLNAITPKRTEAEDVRAGTTVDQLIAQKIGQDTAFPSLELATEDLTTLIGACDSGFSCTYINTLCWATPTTPLPMEINPRVVFERLFGDPGSREQRMARIREDKSILDSIAQEESRLRRGLGTRDNARVTEYLDNIREIERRIQTSEKQAASDLAIPDSPAGVPQSYEDHVGLMFDLMAIAYQADITRVITFMLARELSPRAYPQIGVPDPHHSISHHQNAPDKIEGHAKINTYHVMLFSRFLEKLRQTPDGDGSLLDHSMFVYGSGMANGNQHTHNPLPMVLVGGASGRLKGDRHIKAKTDTPLGNGLLAIAGKAGVDVPAIGESTAVLEL
jgi:Protein of unknown function (DUF1552)